MKTLATKIMQLKAELAAMDELIRVQKELIERKDRLIEKNKNQLLTY
jgi:hypothetical protein